MIYQLFTIFDDSGASVIKGTGKQGVGLILNSLSTLLIAVPFSLYTTFKLDWGLNGIWFGPVCSEIFLATALNFVICQLDWPAITVEIKERAK